MAGWLGARYNRACLLFEKCTHPQLGLNYPAFPSGAKKVMPLCTIRNSNTRSFVASLAYSSRCKFNTAAFLPPPFLAPFRRSLTKAACLSLSPLPLSLSLSFLSRLKRHEQGRRNRDKNIGNLPSTRSFCSLRNGISLPREQRYPLDGYANRISVDKIV